MRLTGDSGTWRLGHRPALDGLRGVAVLLVVASHLTAVETPIHRLGAAGVTMFFTLSGFLITTLLLEERQATGRTRFLRFYWRRALRLLPAMLTMLVVVVVAGGFLGPRYVTNQLLIGSVTYSANFTSMRMGGAGQDALGHMWSLSVEEQFYVLWPVTLLLLVKLLSRRAMVAVIAVGVLVCAWLRFPLWESGGWTRVYYGFDARADALLLGCLLATLMLGRRESAVRPGLAAVALVGIFLTVVGSRAFCLVVAPFLIAALTAAMIFWTVQAGQVRWLTTRPLLWVGRRSYGLYVWHYPVVVAVRQLSPGADAWTMALFVVPLSLALTAISWRYVETPFLRLKDRSRDRVAPAATVDGRRSGLRVAAGQAG